MTAPAATMTYSGPQILLPTEVGEIQVTFTDAANCHASANASGGHDPGDVEYRGRHWYVSLHLHAGSDWNEPGDARHDSGYRHQFTEAGSHSDRTAPPTYRAAIVTAISKAVREYAAAHPAILTAAERNHLEHDLERAGRKAAEQRQALDEAEAAVSELAGRLAQLREPGSI